MPTPKKKKATPSAPTTPPDLMSLVGQKVWAWPHHPQSPPDGLKMRLSHVDLNAGTVTLRSKKRLLIMSIDNVVIEVRL